MARIAAFAVGLLMIIIPLGWVCLQMAQHAPGGTALFCGIAGAVALGAGAIIAGLLFH
jgi:hypothetical protein